MIEVTGFIEIVLDGVCIEAVWNVIGGSCTEACARVP